MLHPLIQYVESKQARKDVPAFRTGDTVRVHWKVREGEKERVQPFEGVVIRKTKGEVRGSFTVRKMSYGVGVERIFPLHSPRYERIEVVNRGDVRRSRLFYLRNLRGKASKVDTQETEQPGLGAAAPAAASAERSAPPAEPAPVQAAPAAAEEKAPAKEKAPSKKAGKGKGGEKA